jgi:predicted RNase H-like HicB family nuclease
MSPVKKIIQVYISRGESHFVAECLDLPVVTQGKTLDELAQNLREAIALQLEGEKPNRLWSGGQSFHLGEL